MDSQAAITGSYNWTVESDEENFENLVILHDQEVLEACHRAVALLWEQAAGGSRSGGFHCAVSADPLFT